MFKSEPAHRGDSGQKRAATAPQRQEEDVVRLVQLIVLRKLLSVTNLNINYDISS